MHDFALVIRGGGRGEGGGRGFMDKLLVQVSSLYMNASMRFRYFAGAGGFARGWRVYLFLCLAPGNARSGAFAAD